MVIAILTVIVGAVAIASLPVSQFPNIVPPEIQLLATYVGADARTLEQSVATPIYQQINGVDNINYMYSLNATGNSQTTEVVNFDVKTDPNNDLILIQSRETQAASQLPADVNNYGVTVQKSATAPLMLVALQDWRSTLIPLLVPVSLIGTFVFFPLFGFSINTLSTFGLVLAIGLVVDDAIVVVEGVQRHIEEGLDPKEAARKAMAELSGPVIGIPLVLSAVFVPTAFIPGITGRLYQQFAVTIATSVLLSAFNALTLSPALAALLLRHKKESTGILQRFFGVFNRLFERATEGYGRWSGRLLQKSVLTLVLLAAAGAVGTFFAGRVPSSFLPDDDQGYLYLNMQLPNSASFGRTAEAAAQVEKILACTPGVEYTTSVVGFSLLSFVRTSYNGFFFVTLKPWDERTTRKGQFQEIKARLNAQLSKLPDGIVFSFSPPAIPGVGTSGGFQFVLEDRAGRDVQFLADNLNKFLAAAGKRPEIGMISTTFLPHVPQRFIDVDRDKALKQGVPVGDVYRTIQAYM